MIRIILIQFIILIILTQANSSNSSCTITLIAHKHCSNSQQSIQILSKLAQQYNNTNSYNISLMFIVDIREGYHVDDGVVYPLIVIRSDSRQIRYQNQLSLVELQYWISVACIRKVPSCASWMTQPIFPINAPRPADTSDQYEQHVSLINFIINNPAIKICNDVTLPFLNTTNTTTQHKAVQNTIYQLLHGLPIFSKFTHNIRNYMLINQQITAIILITNVKIAGHASMKQNFMDIVSYIRRRDNRIGYHIGDQARKSLIFITDTVNSKLVGKLLQFLNIDADKVTTEGAVIGFRFRQSSYYNKQQILEGIQYPTLPNKPLDNKFLFWLEQLSTSLTNPTLHHKLFPPSKPCTHNSITITHTADNIHSTIENLAVMKFMQDVSLQEDRQYYGEMIFRRVLELTDCQQCNREQIEQIVRDVLDTDKYIGYKLERLFGLLEIEQIGYTDHPYIQVCIVDNNILYFETVQQLFAHLLTNKYITSVNNIPQTESSPDQL